jgi:uncharacterized phage protein (TIGR01671 family)
MREIKFRGWGVDAEMMHDWEQVQKITDWWKHGAVALMQYTGLKDENGKEIYEGDIITVTKNGYKDKIAVVNYDDNQVGFIYQNPKERVDVDCGKRCYDVCFLDGTMEEVIGNIYENSELLK